jgi:putative N6-adenine-specific DNA methylase
MKYIGLKPSKNIKLMNGELECSFRRFEIYEGSQKDK